MDYDGLQFIAGARVASKGGFQRPSLSEDQTGEQFRDAKKSC